MNLTEVFIENPVIAAIRDEKDLEKVLESNVKIVFVLFGNIINIRGICHKLKEKQKKIFVHVDMIDGLKGDAAGIEYLKECVELDGIISTKTSNIKHATQVGLYAIQRIFIIDSLSLKTGIKNILEHRPTAVEVMPGIASKIINKLEAKVKNIPIIAGGLIKEKKDVIESLSAGAVAISTTSRDLWDL
ncbi:glycerol-3-phosphate responsive antiterminator [Clostridium sp. FAM 1755]|uniref:Glycerol-3-phosphate responsive antiterminator n=1 Tax=Clostridium botulinum TaxID=1491 RepID=A0A6M0T0X4_CLOBO|nr:MULTISPECIES: glycerol-3-phosphate responsive antiterminator [Clostridium]EJP6471002.1 glycerol-3-phosphate responsive antiterminator [Clostridium botulinum]KOR25072.1 glycerol uptake operon antiterminator regulatory protein [Clostridium sp. L74]NFA61033.1 glycerol-3-phosphate responsive antiterminator [Clostridium botulinum]NFI73759.1 glycerol-3-phosphate responsive antiterminator [Clostridium sporogenes]NFL73596.1 glycerol-3-phosphate responsive antiterminator [Clostridium sporogenes]